MTLTRGFEQANSTNLPEVNIMMTWEYLKSDTSYTMAEIRGAKADRSMRANYVDASVGYVQLKREDEICFVQGEICHEHKTSSKNYQVAMEIDENNEKIRSVKCLSCPASQGGCKHALAFMMWVQRRAAEPSPIEVQSYWRKPRLSRIAEKEVAICSNFGVLKTCVADDRTDVLQTFLQTVDSKSLILMKSMFSSSPPTNLKLLDIYYQILQFKKTQFIKTADEFLNYCIRNNITKDMCWQGCQLTEQQSDSPLWHTLRFGRVTASYIFNAARCHTDGVLVQQILGAKTPLTRQMSRGKQLESDVLKAFTNKKKLRVSKSKVGLLIEAKCSELGASPDGLGDNFVLEVKCPSKHSTISHYITESGQIKEKFRVQFQMFIFKKTKGVLGNSRP